MKQEILGNITLYNCDCMDYMATCKDNQFDLAIVDPPYGNDNIKGGYTSGKGGGVANQKTYNKALWNQPKPSYNFFIELRRISKNQIIWGANHLVSYLPISSGWIFWDKLNGNVSFSDGELAYTSFNIGLRKYEFRWAGMLQGNMKNKQNRIHPTEKPVKLYEWLLYNYAKPGQKIFDSHFGSLSIGVACHNLGFELTACELDKEYYEAAKKRLKVHQMQKTIFDFI